MALSFCGRRIPVGKSFFLTPKRSAYIVLVPEIGEDLPDKNPLMTQDGLPEFNNLTIEKCVAAVTRQTNDFESGVVAIEESIVNAKKPIDIFKTIINPIELVGTPLDTTWGLAKTLYVGNKSLMPTKSYLAIHDRALRARSTKFNSIPIYTTLKNHLIEVKDLPDEKKRIVQKFVLEGKLNGLELTGSSQIRFQENCKQISQERSTFKSKLEAGTKMFSHTIRDAKCVSEFPPDLLKSMAVDRSEPDVGPWKVTMQPHISIPFMKYCPDRELRWNLWQAEVRRGSGYYEKSVETSTHLEKIRKLRHEQAKLLGFESFADMSMETKMAGGLKEVHKMIENLLGKAKPAQELELKELEEYAVQNGFQGKLQLWDIPYWKRKQQQLLLNHEEDKIRDYFPLTTVLDGLFQLCERLFNVTIRERKDVVTWHEDVKYYDIFESHVSAPVAGFYLDPYSRHEEKLRATEDGGFMVGIRNRSNISETNPLAALVFNFQPPTENKPSLLNFRDMRVLFDKFGHALQHLLTSVSYSEVAGLSNIEWDAVDICGHVLSHWLYDSNTMRSLSCHYSSEEQIPASVTMNISQARTHLAGYELCRELYLASLDLQLHTKKDFWLNIVRNLWPEYNCLPLEKHDSHVCSFASIFSDEWGAAYYSRVWSRLVAADVYSAFHEVQGDPQQTADVGKRFRETFLALGGACHPSQVFRRFRGRDPSPKALIRTLGLKKVAPVQENVELVT